jgi:hypothetical protein
VELNAFPYGNPLLFSTTTPLYNITNGTGHHKRLYTNLCCGDCAALAHTGCMERARQPRLAVSSLRQQRISAFPHPVGRQQQQQQQEQEEQQHIQISSTMENMFQLNTY